MKTPLLILAAVGLAIPSAAIAKTTETSSVTVNYRDLNLATAEGQDVLADRIEIAARQVCGYNRQLTGSRMRDRDAERCVSETTKNMNAQFAAVIEQSAKGG
ncbi:UrcA family protein [Qipengyuania psychrotolerans]|uniref:UrcA family protein n=1 Tax=Qipengyuania psychrotolerans TaxID=2867238 RepID=A0ABX8ZDE5_9SPHN|nr:UrcA family protein [Qipengyuania psychrotolerans]QZD87021.1 UrcA family protein [Qipengyuania psychrotolerans]